MPASFREVLTTFTDDQFNQMEDGKSGQLGSGFRQVLRDIVLEELDVKDGKGAKGKEQKT